MDKKQEMEENIREWVQELAGPANSIYRQPLVGMAQAADPLFPELKRVVAEKYYLPQDLLPGAKTVVAYFIPFTLELIKMNQETEGVAKEWVQAYIDTNALIERINHRMENWLMQEGIHMAYQPPSHNMDREKLISLWSHKHTAFIAGLGTFGHHQMLITPLGCGGRFGSFIIDQELEAHPQVKGEYCLQKGGRSCLMCVKECPAQALTREGLEKERCYQWLQKISVSTKTGETSPCCGKCVTGPCALQNPMG